MDDSVLNPVLYQRLQSAYGRVTVAHRGLEFDYDTHIDPFTGQLRLDKHGACENYRVNCPFCGDKRQRLYFNYPYGQKLKDGRVGTMLVHCMRRGCLRDPENRWLVWDRLKAGGRPLTGARLNQALAIERPTHCSLPGTCPRLVDLPMHHKANSYLIVRGFDPVELSRLHDLRYCSQCFDVRLSPAIGRIIIPIRRKGKVVGWQGRYVGDINFKREDIPKYFNWPHMDKSSWVIELAKARRYHTGVIVEGYPSVWRVGRMCMPLLGQTLNDQQIRMIKRAFRGGAVVYLPDPDVWADRPEAPPADASEGAKQKYHTLMERWRKHEEFTGKLRRMFGRGGLTAQADEGEEVESPPGGKFADSVQDDSEVPLALVRLPDGFDPGDLDTDLARDFIQHEAGKQGVKVRWRRRSKSGYGGSACRTAD